MNLVSGGAFLKSPTCGGALIIFFTKAVFCKAQSYGVLHSSSGGLVLKLRTFKGASLSMIFCSSWIVVLLSVLTSFPLGLFWKASTHGGALITFSTKAVFCKPLSYGIHHLSKGGLVWKLWTFKRACMFMLLFQFIGFKVLDIKVPLCSWSFAIHKLLHYFLLMNFYIGWFWLYSFLFIQYWVHLQIVKYTYIMYGHTLDRSMLSDNAILWM